MKKTILWGALALLAAVVLAGCSGSGGGGEAGAIRGRYSELARGVERENIGAVMALFSPDYYDYGHNYVDVRAGFAQLFDTYDDIDDSYTFDSIEVRGNYAEVYGVETLGGVNTWKPNRPYEVSDTEFYDLWRKIGGRWYLYGDQTNGQGAGAARKPLRYSPERMRDARPGKK